MSEFREAFKTQKPKGEPRSIPAALVIGLTSFEGMERCDAETFAIHMGNILKNLRFKNIPILWGAIGKGGNKLIVPENPYDTSPFPLDFLLDEMQFDEENGQGVNSDIHHQFLRDFGPRNNEVVYRKVTKDTLLDPSELELHAENRTRSLLLNEAGLLVASGVDLKQIISEQFKDPSLFNFAKERRINHLLIMGGMSSHCISETAISAARKGIKTKIAVDGVLSWDREIMTREERDEARIIWGDEIAHEYHLNIIETALTHYSNDLNREFLSSDIEAIKKIEICKALEFIRQSKATLTPNKPQPS